MAFGGAILDLSIAKQIMEILLFGGRAVGGHFKMYRLWALQSVPPRLG
jgi:hypothetical protein